MKPLNKILFIAIIFSIVNFSFAKANTEDRHLTGFNAVNVAGAFDVYITQGSTESVKVDAPADVIDRIVTEVEGGTLKIYNKNNKGFNWNWNGNKKMIVYVSIKNVNAVSLTGSGDVYFKEGLRADNFKLKLTGSGDVTGKLDVKSLESNLSGSGDIRISGHTDNSNVSVVGSGDYTAQNLISANTAVRVVGSGDAKVYASEKLDALVAGSGDVYYAGSPKNVNKSKSGSGEINRM